MPDIDYDLSTHRLSWLTAAVGAGGAIIGLAVWGKNIGGGFALGALGSFGNLWLWRLLAGTLGGASKRRSSVVGVLFAARFLVLFAFAYVIVRNLGIHPLAAILGLLSSSVAVVAEVLIELVASRRLQR
jgi:hypothetical protein